MGRKKQLTEKQRLFARNLVRSKGDQKAAYLETYPKSSRSSAAAGASRLLTNKPEILLLAREALEKQGVTLEQLSKKLKEKLDCEKALTVGNDVHYVNDNSSQLKAVELSYKIHGALKDNDNSVNINNQYNQQTIISNLGDQLGKVLQTLGNIGSNSNNNNSNNSNKLNKRNNELIEAEFDVDD